ncbi:MAG: hypothetical protein IPP90_12655 [Gemmatimonadaceae bacterium]|nr:hypothetical protein [Gemmatimonadaceae bacterium]
MTLIRIAAIVVALIGVSVSTASAQPKAPLPPESTTGQRMLELARGGEPQRAASIGHGYLAMHPGPPRTGAHCAILVAYAYADVLLNRTDEARAAIGVYDRGCKQRTFRDEFRLEAKRVHRVLAGEALTTVYPTAVPAKPKGP